MKWHAVPFAFLVALMSTAQAQPAATPRPPGVSGPAVPATTVPAPPVLTPTPAFKDPGPMVPVTPAARALAARIFTRLEDYRAHKASTAISDSALAASGLSPEHDFREQAKVFNGVRYTPFNAGKLVPVSADEVTLGFRVDPALTSTFSATLRARLGRAPTLAEIASEVQAFDTEIARQNLALATARQEIGARYQSDGRFPRDLESRWINVAPPDPTQADTARYRAEWGRFFGALMKDSVEKPQLPPRRDPEKLTLPPIAPR